MALHSMGYICSSVGASFYPQGLTLASNCSQLPGAGRKKPLNIAEFLALLGVGEGLAPPESPRAIQGNQRAGQATRPLPQRNRMVQQNPRRRERRFSRVGPEVETTQS